MYLLTNKVFVFYKEKQWITLKAAETKMTNKEDGMTDSFTKMGHNGLIYCPSSVTV